VQGEDMETMRVELVESKKAKKNYLQALISLVTAIVAVLGILISYMSFTLTAEERITQREDAQRTRFTYAIEHLKDESLAIRMGALFELQKLGLENEDLQEIIVRILNPFIREGIENKDLLLPSRSWNGLLRPKEDVFLACEIASLFWEQTNISLTLHRLHAEKLDLSGIMLKGALITNANFQESHLATAQFEGSTIGGANLLYTNLVAANLQKTALSWTNFQEAGLGFANFSGADLKNAKNLTAAQLLRAHIDETTLLDPDLRAEYDRLKAEQNKQ